MAQQLPAKNMQNLQGARETGLLFHMAAKNCINTQIQFTDSLSPPPSDTSTRHSTCNKIVARKHLSYRIHQNKTTLFLHQLCTNKLCIMIFTCFCILHIRVCFIFRIVSAVFRVFLECFKSKLCYKTLINVQ